MLARSAGDVSAPHRSCAQSHSRRARADTRSLGRTNTPGVEPRMRTTRACALRADPSGPMTARRAARALSAPARVATRALVVSMRASRALGQTLPGGERATRGRPVLLLHVHPRALDRRPDRRPGRSAALHRFGHRDPAALHGGGRARRARPRRPRRLPVHPRRPRRDVPQAAVDDAPVRGLRLGDRVQRALQVPARQRLDRPVDGLRPADPAGPGLRRPALPRRGRPHRRLDRHDRRHADGVRGDPAQRDLDVDDDQRAGDGAARAVLARRRGAGLPAARSCAGRRRTTCSRSTSRAATSSIPPRGRCG